MTSQSTYLLSTGSEDIERLGILNKIYNPYSERLIQSAQLQSGDTVMDIGCGHGQITSFLSTIIGPKGKVFAVDNASDQIEIARQNCREHTNISFHVASIMDEKICDAIKPNSLDAIYCRFVLIHVPDAVIAIKNMLSLLKPNGKLILEEPYIQPTRFLPTDQAQASTKRLPNIFSECDIPLTLFPKLRQLPVEILSYTLAQPVCYTKELKRMPMLSLKQRAPLLVDKYGATWEQIESTLKFYESCINDDNIYLIPYTVYQFIAVKH